LQSFEKEIGGRDRRIAAATIEIEPAIALACLGPGRYVKLCEEGMRSPTTTSNFGKQSKGVAMRAA